MSTRQNSDMSSTSDTSRETSNMSRETPDTSRETLNDTSRAASADIPPARKPRREYERTGMYPKEGKQFRMFALLGWLAVVVVLIAATAALLDFMLIY